MVYVPPHYPTTIPTSGDLPDRVDDVDWLYAARYNELKKELRAALTELGTLPKGAAADVAARLNLFAPILTPTFNGLVTIPSLSITGGACKFPTSQVVSGDPNTLDDYERGTWTVALSFGGGVTGITYNSQAGIYTKIGNLVTVTAFLSLTSKGTDTGAALITGLPFTVANVSGNQTPVIIRNLGFAFANQFQGVANINTTTITLEETVEAVSYPTVITDADFVDTTQIQIQATYRV